MGSRTVDTQIPLTCPACGAPVPWAEAANLPVRCRRCGAKLEVLGWRSALLTLLSTAVAVALPWALGLRSIWLALAAAALWFLLAVFSVGAQLALWPPRFRLAPPRPGRARYLPSTRTLPWNRPITLGLSDPPPSSDPKPEPGEKRSP